MTEFAYGLDFGTSKTSLAFARCGGARPAVTDVLLTERREARTSTCVLYFDGQGVRGVGSPAEEHYWTFLTDDERRQHALRTNFKPHVPTDPEAEGVARDFLQAIRDQEDVRRELDPPAERVTVVGTPAAWNEKAEKRLLSILVESGFPAPRALPEPVGALFHFLAARLRAEDLEKDILVIDWGAGTCDFSLMRRGRPSEEDSWGSSVYGGRLFDDLFFQWFVEQAREDPARRDRLEKILAAPPLEGTLREFRARELKEEFSTWSRKFPRAFRSRLVELGDRDLGRLKVDNFAEFEERARRYVATDAMRKRLADLAADALPSDRAWLEPLLAGEPVDLMDWGATLVQEGGRGRVRPADVAVVILAGGSTLWPWFQALVEQPGTYAEGVQVYTDGRPELTIARGLAAAHAVGTHAQTLVARAEEKKDELVAALHQGFLEPRMKKLCGKVVKRFLQDRYDSAVRIVAIRLRARRITAEEANEYLDGVFREWLDSGGREVMDDAIRQVNEEAPKEIRSIAADHGIRVEDLLRLAVDVCAPFGQEDWNGWLSKSQLSRDLVEQLQGTILDDLFDAIGALIALPFQALGWLVDQARNLIDSDKKRELRELRQEQERRDKAREEAERLYEKVQTRLHQAFQDRMRDHEALREWAGQMHDFLRDKLATVARLADPATSTSGSPSGG